MGANHGDIAKMVPLEGLCTDYKVDWSTHFETFYEVVRVKVAVRDVGKIPSERLFEMDTKLFLISITTEGMNGNGTEPKGNYDGGGDDDDKMNDEEADDLDDSS